MSLKIVTGKTAQAHVTSDDDAALNSGVFGTKSVVFSIGEQLSAEILSANSVRINDGDFSLQGKVGRILPGTYETVSIQNGATEYSRNDIISVKYQKDGSGIENMELFVTQGEPSENTPQDPSITIGDMRNGDTTVYFPLYRVKIVGLSIASIEKLFNITPTVTSSAPIGSGMDYFGLSEPYGWLFCNGQAVRKSDYPELFEIIGYTYSNHQSGTTFNLPDLRGRVMVGINSTGNFNQMGKKVGESEHTLTVEELPEHEYSNGSWGNTFSGAGGDTTFAIPYAAHPNVTSALIGRGQSHNNIQPSFVCHKIIRAF